MLKLRNAVCGSPPAARLCVHFAWEPEPMLKPWPR